MRLLNTTTGRFEIIIDPRSVRYAILSHVWARPEDSAGYKPEQTYQEVLRRIVQAGPDGDVLSRLSEKIRKACEIARMHGFGLIWIDTCCIDQTSSAEVSESINSMFEWYSCSNVCYAFLDTVEQGDHARHKASQFRRSRWFKRGWTLQELIAPQNVLFLSRTWTLIGTKYSLAHIIEEETEIDAEVIRHNRMPSEVPVAQRMGWASKRNTTKMEDAAYCLVGIFGVNLTPIYGEGLRNAFIRLQQAILDSTPDQSIFVWGKHASASSLSSLSVDSTYSPGTPDPFVLASSPTDFIERLPHTTLISPERLAERLGGQAVKYPRYTLTSSGLCTRLPLIQYQQSDVDYWLAILSCEDRQGNLIALILHPVSGPVSSSPTRSSSPETALCVGVSASEAYVGSRGRALAQTGSDSLRIVTLSQAQIDFCLKSEGKFHPDAEVYIRHCPLGTELSMHGVSNHNRTRLTQDMFPHLPFDVMLSEWSDQLLRTNHQFLVETHPSGAERSCTVELKKGNETITVSLQRCDCTTGQSDGELCVKVRPAPAKSKGPHCKTEHVAQWPYRDGIACTTYGLKQLSNGEARYLRVSLSLRDSSPNQLGHSQYILDIELLTHPNNASHSLPPLHHANADASPISGTKTSSHPRPETTLRQQALRRGHGTHPLPGIAVEEASSDGESERPLGRKGSGHLPRSSTVPPLGQKLPKKADPNLTARHVTPADDAPHHGFVSAPDKSQDRQGDLRPMLGRLDTNLTPGSGQRRRRGESNDSTVYDRSRPRSDSPAQLDSDPQAFDPNDPFIQTMTGQTLTPVSAQSTQRRRAHGPASFNDVSSRDTHGQKPPENVPLGRPRSASNPKEDRTRRGQKEKRRSRFFPRLWNKRISD